MTTRWPNLFLVGAPRAGTTSLWAYLSEHPAVFMSSRKEPHFFSGLETNGSIHAEEPYLALFDGAGDARWRGDASTSYLSNATSPARIQSVAPDARILVSLREPIDRAHSTYRFRRRHEKEERPFVEAIEADLEHARTDPATSRYIGWSLYADALERYWAAFGRENVKVLFYEELAAAPRPLVADLFAWLDVDPARAETMRFDRHNSSAPPRNALARRLLSTRRLRRLARRIAPPAVRGRIEGRLLAAPQSGGLDPAAHALLEQAFAADRARLEELLERPLPWR